MIIGLVHVTIFTVTVMFIVYLTVCTVRSLHVTVTINNYLISSRWQCRYTICHLRKRESESAIRDHLSKVQLVDMLETRHVGLGFETAVLDLFTPSLPGFAGAKT